MSSLLQAPARPKHAPIATFSHDEFDRAGLRELKGSAFVSVCIPARDEEATVGEIVEAVRSDLVEPLGLVDEIVVIDDCSADATAARSKAAGATVLEGPGSGKGEAMSLARGRADLVVFLDGDVRNFSSHFVIGLLGPLLRSPETVLVKASYKRPVVTVGGGGSTPLAATGQIAPAGGGRVTELVAKPLIELYFPELVAFEQPLAGETALRGHVLDELELDGGYGVEIGLLLDAARTYGLGALAQVDLGARLHRNRPLEELGPQARQVLASALRRAGPKAPPFRTSAPRREA